MLTNLIVNTAYYLNTSKRYQEKKTFFYNLLQNDKYKYKKYVDIFMITLIFISVAILIREVKHPVGGFLLFFSNYIISIIFLIEYILRLWVDSSVSAIIVERAEHDTFLGRDVKLSKALSKAISVKIQYILSFYAIIDILAILPFFHELRLLRLFILFRVFKLFRYAKSFQTLAGVLATKRFEFITLALFAFMVIFISAILIYAMEANNSASPIHTLFDAIYWSIVTISTVGYGDITPITQEGRVVAIIVIVTGIAVLAFSTSLVVSAFTEKIDEIKEIKTVDDVSKLQEFYLICGYQDIAHEVAQKLTRHGNTVIVIDDDENAISRAKKDSLIALAYSPGSVKSYAKLHLDISKHVKAVLCLYEDDVKNVYTSLTVRSISKDVPVLSLLMEENNRKKLEYAGINKIVYPQELVGLIAKEFVGKPAAFEVIHELRSENSKVKIDEVAVTQRIAENVSMVQYLNNKKFRVVLLGVYKKESDRFFFNPLDSTLIETGDYLLVIGYRIFIAEFEKHLHTRVKDE